MKVATDERDVLERIARWADAQALVRAVLLTSSRADPTARRDTLSDYDVVLILADVDPFVAGDEWLAGVGRPLLRVRDAVSVFGVTKHNCMVLYDDGTKVDYSLWSPALLQRVREVGNLPEDLDGGNRVLLDKDALTDGLPPPTRTAHLPGKPTEREYQDLIQEFWFVATYVAKYLWRDELMPVKVILDYEAKFLLLRKLLAWQTDRTGFFGRGLKDQLDPDTWARLEATYVGPDRSDNWAALFATIALFRPVAVDMGNALDYTYPHDLDARMMGYLRQIQRLEPALS